MGPAVRESLTGWMVGAGCVQCRGFARVESRCRFDGDDGCVLASMDVPGDPIGMGVPAGCPDRYAVPAGTVLPILNRSVTHPDLFGGVDLDVLDGLAALGRRIVQDVVAEHLAPARQILHELVGCPAIRCLESLAGGVVDDDFLASIQRCELDRIGGDDMLGGIHAPVADLHVVRFAR